MGTGDIIEIMVPDTTTKVLISRQFPKSRSYDQVQMLRHRLLQGAGSMLLFLHDPGKTQRQRIELLFHGLVTASLELYPGKSAIVTHYWRGNYFLFLFNGRRTTANITYYYVVVRGVNILIRRKDNCKLPIQVVT